MSVALTIFLVVMTIIIIMTISAIIIFMKKINCVTNCAGKCSTFGTCVCDKNWGGKYCNSCVLKSDACGGTERGECIEDVLNHGDLAINTCKCNKYDNPTTDGVNFNKPKYVGLGCQMPTSGMMDYSCNDTNKKCPDGYSCDKSTCFKKCNVLTTSVAKNVSVPDGKGGKTNKDITWWPDCLSMTDICTNGLCIPHPDGEKVVYQ